MSCRSARLLRSLVFALSPVVLATALPAHAATPTSGTLSVSTPELSYTSGPFFVTNSTAEAAGLGVTDLLCAPAQAFPCDEFTLTVSLPADYATRHPYDRIRISTAFPATPQEDFDLYLLDAAKSRGLAQSNGTDDPEVILLPPVGGSTTYVIRIVPTTAAGDSTMTTISLVAGTAPPPPPPPSTIPGARFQTYTPGKGLGDSSQGEFNIGYNPKTGRIMTLASSQTYRVTPPEKLSPAQPEACDALWEDVSPLVTSSPAGLDPILWTEQGSGRTIASNNTTGPNAEYAYTDDDGANWTQVGIALPSATIDHQTIGTGPYPAASPFAQVAQALGVNYATYYCAQTDFPAFCERSDDGGRSYGPPSPIYNGVVSSCGGIHGHVRVAPNGTVYVPNRSCGTNQGAAVSNDAGVTWHESLVPTSSPSNSDPEVALASDNTAYFCYTSREGHARVAVSHDDGATWGDDFDIGAAMGIENAVFPQSIAGDPKRAACGFIGTTTPGNYQATDFPGIWYLYIATTYDGGKTWTTVNATPNDPVQGAGGICQGGIGCTGGNRNLLDFNEITLGDRGRILFGYDDGCVGDCVLDPTRNSYVGDSRIARQSGGRGMLAAFDTPEPALPNRSCLAGVRDSAAAHLNWKAPDNSGSDISGYKIYRSTGSSGDTLVATIGNKRSFDDRTVTPSVPNFTYKVTAVNAKGEGLFSNAVTLPVTVPVVEDRCHIPGLSLLSDGNGDAVTTLAQHDLLSLQVSEPYAASDAAARIVFQFKVASLAAPLTPNSFYYSSFMAPDGTIHAVRMLVDATGTAPTFETYVPSGNTSGGIDGRFVDSTTIKPAEAGSGFTPDGTITIVVKPANVGIATLGQNLSGFNSAVVVPIGAANAGAAETVDEMPNGLGRSGSFKSQPNAFCEPNQPPQAALSADHTSGQAPLTVAFDGSGSRDPNAFDNVASYSFDFGDGSDAVTQDAPGISHTFFNPGFYPVRLTVTDSHGARSVDYAQVIIEVLDTTPDAFAFTAQRNVNFDTDVISNAVTISGLSGAAPISVIGGSYSINGGAFTSAAGQIVNGASVRVRQHTANAAATSRTTTLTIGGASGDFTTTTGNTDFTPDAFTLNDVSGVPTNTEQLSNTVTVSGLGAGAAVNLVVRGGQYSLNGGAFTTASGRATNGDRVAVRHVSASSGGSSVSTQLTIGTVSDSFTSTTDAASDTNPDAFSFTSVSGANPGTPVASAPVTPVGYNAPAAIRATNGALYSVDGSAFTSASGIIHPGQSVRVQVTSSPNPNTRTYGGVQIGTTSGSFSVQTKP